MAGISSSGNVDNEKWIVDTGATLTSNKNLLHSDLKVGGSGKDQLPNMELTKVCQIGNCTMKGGNVTTNVLYMPAF